MNGTLEEAHRSYIPIQTDTGLRLSALNPKYLHTNSTSHTWPFSAIAELVDNAYDPDVKASQLHIDLKNYNTVRGNSLAMIFADNGNGMTPEKLYKMLSFGFCEKVAVKNHMPVGHYGNGFKSGSMRLGRDALVFTKSNKTKSVGFLSQTFLEAVKADTVIVPMVTWNLQDKILENAEETQSLPAILKYSVIQSMAAIQKEFNSITSKTGTTIIISGLRKCRGKESEFDFDTPGDIRIPDDALDSDGCKFKREERQHHIPGSDYSLRAYLAILYLKPRMQIFLRGKKVKTVVIQKSLNRTEVDLYKPAIKKHIFKIVFGFSENMDHYGVMMYHRNRLIKPYVRVGCQLKANNMGVGVIGVIECNCLQPTHNKQDFDYTALYRSTMAALGQKLNEYWNEKMGDSSVDATVNNLTAEHIPDELWVQCDNTNCLKWRRMPSNIKKTDLPDKWYCRMHPLPAWQSCTIPEEEEEPVDNVKPYEKKLKKIEKEIRQKETDKVKSNKIDIEIERRRREKAEFERNQNRKELENVRYELAQLKKDQLNTRRIQNQSLIVQVSQNRPVLGQPQVLSPSPILTSMPPFQSTPIVSRSTSMPNGSKTVNKSIRIVPRSVASRSSSAPGCPNYPTTTQASSNSYPAVMTALSRSQTDLNATNQTSSTKESSSQEFPDSPCAMFTIKEENEITQTNTVSSRLHATANMNSERSGSRKRPINLDSSDEEDDMVENDSKKIIKTEATDVKNPLPSNNNLAPHSSPADFFKLYEKNCTRIDKDIIEDLKKQKTPELGLLLATRSQALRNLRQKVVALLQTIVSDELKLPDISNESLEETGVEDLLNTVISINQVVSESESGDDS